MARRVTVTSAEQSAARSIVKRNARKGVPTPDSVTKIANARGLSRYAGNGAPGHPAAAAPSHG
jgi:hypothetical protein